MIIHLLLIIHTIINSILNMDIVIMVVRRLRSIHTEDEERIGDEMEDLHLLMAMIPIVEIMGMAVDGIMVVAVVEVMTEWMVVEVEEDPTVIVNGLGVGPLVEGMIRTIGTVGVVEMVHAKIEEGVFRGA
jgi:hypothetical protein